MGAGQRALPPHCIWIRWRVLPVTLDLNHLRVALVGAGAAAQQRLERLDAAGARDLTVYARHPSQALAAQAGLRLVERLPNDRELAGNQIVFIAGLAAQAATAIAERVRALGVIVHVEDMPAISDVRMPAVLHRGDLTIAISTSGRSPGLAAALKRALDRIIGPEWGARLDQIAAARARWRVTGLDPAAVAQRTGDWLTARGWLASDAALESHWVSGATAKERAETATIDAET
jgi:precorrin-2 dehydrogenase/sirohydrochlorin ferrochelatase